MRTSIHLLLLAFGLSGCYLSQSFREEMKTAFIEGAKAIADNPHPNPSDHKLISKMAKTFYAKHNKYPKTFTELKTFSLQLNPNFKLEGPEPKLANERFRLIITYPKHPIKYIITRPNDA